MLDRRARMLALPAGVFFAADLIFWHHAIQDVGAGLATVLGNLQVVVVPFVAWAVLGERVQTRLLAALPLVCSGVLLISGVLESGAYGADPVRGVMFGILTGLTYAGFLLVLRQAGSDLRRTAGPLFTPPRWPPSPRWPRGSPSARRTCCRAGRHAWLVVLPLTSQVLGWLLIASSLPRLPAALTSVTLTIQPVGSVLLGVVLLGEEPSGLQLVGVAFILAGLVSVALRRAPARVAEPA